VLGPSDRLFLLPVFYAGGTPGAGVSIGDLADRIRASGRNVEVAADYADLAGRVGPLLGPGVSLLIMGARDPELTSFARRMAGA
jgi:UDP-N-acetylmuramate--alanine ligase